MTEPLAAPSTAEPRPSRLLQGPAGLLLAGALIVAAAYLLLGGDPGRPFSSAPPPQLRGEPDLFIEGAVIHQYRDKGTLAYRLQASRITRFEGSAQTRLLDPRVRLHPEDDDRPPWQSRANFGYTRPRLLPTNPDSSRAPSDPNAPAGNTADGAAAAAPGAANDTSREEIIFLREDVRMTRRLTARSQFIVLADAMYIYPEQQLAATDDGVIIHSNAGRSQGKNFRADLVTGRVHLGRRVNRPGQRRDAERVSSILEPHQFK
ncbi:MAG: LPS export ABC transporter periplasmic protein LptC [Pseudomonadota bacterium]